jgi:hypothetical protein
MVKQKNRPTYLIFIAVMFCSLILNAGRKEYEVKAAFVCKFLKYIKFDDKQQFYHIGIVGDNPFQGFMKKNDGKIIAGRPIKIHFYEKNDDKLKASQCHIYFIANSVILQQKNILNVINQPNCLTVGDNKWFTKSGGMLNLLTISSNTSWEINKKAIEDNKIKISSKILRLAVNKDE